MMMGIKRALFGSAYWVGGSYVALVIALLGVTVASGLDITERYSAYSTASNLLSQLKHGRSIETNQSNETWPSGSPFLAGNTITVAQAELLERVTTAITDHGGNVVSSEIEQMSSSAHGYLKTIAPR